MRIYQLPNLPQSPQSGDFVAINRGGMDYKGPLGALANAHYDITISESAWTGSGPYTYVFSANTVSADKHLVIEADSNMLTNATSTITVTPGAGIITFTTRSKPNGAVKMSIVVLGAAGDNVGDVTGDIEILKSTVATDYNPSDTYVSPAYCWHEGVLYRCASDTPITGAWDATKWEDATITGDLSAVIANLYSITVSNGALVIQGVTL